MSITSTCTPQQREQELTQHRRVQPVHERNEHRHGHHDEQKVREQEVGRPERHLHDLHHELARRLRERRRAEPAPVPLARPPRPVGLLVLELTREEDRDEDLLDRPLDRDDRDDSQHRVRGIPELEEPLRKRLEQVVT